MLPRPPEAEAGGRGDGGPLTPQQAPSEGQPLYERRWLWIVVGVVVAGATAGTAIALTRDQRGGSKRGEPDMPTRVAP